MQLGERGASQPLDVVWLLACFCSGINSGLGGNLNLEPIHLGPDNTTRGVEKMGKGRQAGVKCQFFLSVHFALCRYSIKTDQ